MWKYSLMTVCWWTNVVEATKMTFKTCSVTSVVYVCMTKYYGVVSACPIPLLGL